MTKQNAQTFCLAAALIVILPACSLRDTPGEQPIVAGSTHIAQVVDDLSGGQCAVHNLIPPAMCPGHFDLRPSDVSIVAQARAILLHPWQKAMPNITDVLSSANTPAGKVIVIDVPGNWMVPEVLAEGVMATAQVLGKVDPRNAAVYQQKAEERREEVLRFGDEQADRLAEAGAQSIRVICPAIIEELVEWAGFDIVLGYERPEDLSVGDVQDLVRTAREAGVTLVVDNLQSGDAHLSRTLARDAGAGHVVLSNFPGGFAETETWEQALTKDVDLLLNAVRTARLGT